MDPDVGRFRPAEAETGLRIENETGVTLERLPGDSPGDWRDTATGKTYDAVGNFDGKFFDKQWANLKEQILKHLDKADFVPIDVSKFTPEQTQKVKLFLEGLHTDRAFIVGENG
jgi:hypothetical protein